MNSAQKYHIAKAAKILGVDDADILAVTLRGDDAVVHCNESNRIDVINWKEQCKNPTLQPQA
jgi:hypothetical protein